jgi:hypothetical protein
LTRLDLVLLFGFIESHVDDTSDTVSSLIISFVLYIDFVFSPLRPCSIRSGDRLKRCDDGGRELTYMHIIETLVDIVQFLVVGNKLVYPEGTLEVVCQSAQ